MREEGHGKSIIPALAWTSWSFGPAIVSVPDVHDASTSESHKTDEPPGPQVIYPLLIYVDRPEDPTDAYHHGAGPVDENRFPAFPYDFGHRVPGVDQPAIATKMNLCIARRCNSER
jgi:hypothetical protein